MILKQCILTIVLLAFTNALVWEEDGDTIGIDGRTEADITEEEFEIIPESTTVSSNNCLTSRGFRGTCMTLEECYPFAKFLSEPGNSENRLQDIYNPNETETCDPANGTVICCPSYGYASLRLRSISPTNLTNVGQQPVVSPTSGGGFNQEDCGHQTHVIDAAVVGGREAKVGEFPYIVAITKGGKHLCGGSIIDKTHILTAAHCVARGINNVNEVRILAGSHTSPSGGTPYSVASMFYNKNFHQSQMGSDVAIIKLAKPLEYTNLIKPICLSTDKTIPTSSYAELAGWGLTSDPGASPGVRPSPVLRTVRMDFLVNADCTKRYSGQQVPPIRAAHVCATGQDGGSPKDSCYGDSGGPLSIVNKGRAEQVGVVSWGLKCGSYPGVYERVAFYLDWIEKTCKR